MSSPSSSKRIRKQTQHFGVVPFDSDSDDDYEEPQTASPKSKKVRKASRVKKVKGSLGSFASLPLDVVAEVASFDLGVCWSLSRLNKSCHQLLASKRVESVWQQARINSGLPQLTASHGPTVLGYAALMYGHLCQSCGKSTTKHPFLGLYVRYCSKCADNLIEMSHDSYFVKRSDVDAAGRSRKGWAYLKSEVSAWRAAGYPTTSGYSQETADRHQDERAMSAWLEARSEERSAERNAIKDARRQAIEEHFRGLGWTDRSLGSPTFQSHSLVNVARELTDRTRDNVFSTLTNVLEGERARVEEENRIEAARLAERNVNIAREERTAHVRLAFSKLLIDDEAQKIAGLFPLPNVEECLEMETVKLLYYPVDAVFTAETVLAHSFDSIAAELEDLRESFKLQFVDGWIAAVTAKPTSPTSPPPVPGPLLSSLLPEPDGPNETFTSAQKDEILGRATTICSCPVQHCDAVGPWELIFSHTCSNRIAPRSLKLSSYTVPTTRLGIVPDLIALADLKMNATVQEMNEVGGGRAFSCLSCNPSLGSIARSWTQMLLHLLTRHWSIFDKSLADQRLMCEQESEAVARLLKASAEHSKGF